MWTRPQTGCRTGSSSQIYRIPRGERQDLGDIERVLVTGGCGFVGANLVRYLGEKTGWGLTIVDDLRTGRRGYLDDLDVDVVIADAGDPVLLEDVLQDVDAVVHLASETGVVPSIEDPIRDFSGNAATCFRVLESCRSNGVSRFVYASSGAALGDVEPPLHEEVVPKPLSPYGAGKLAGEAYCQAYAGSYGMHTVALRFANVYGPYSDHKKNAIPNFIRRSLTGESLEIFGDGSQTRDFIYVDDLCDGIFRSLTTEGAAGEVFQLATNVETSVTELAALIQKVTDSTTDLQFEPARTGEVYRSRADVSKANRILGFEPRVSLEEGLRRTTEWFKAHVVSR